jgi:hypothetical protein
MKFNRNLGLFLAVFILLIGNSLALEFDNVKSYDSAKNEITISDSFLGIPTTDVAKITLDTPQINYVMAGYDRKVAEFTIDLYKDNYNDFIKNIELIDLKTGNFINREVNYKYKVVELKEIEVNDYKDKCYVNENKTETCNAELVGSHKETIENAEWYPFDKFDLSKGKITIGIFTDVNKNDNVEWYPTLFGVKITEWAVWTDSMSVGLKDYFTFNNRIGNEFLNSANGSFNMSSISNPSIAGGKNLNFVNCLGANFSMTNNPELIDSVEFSASVWVWTNHTGNTQSYFFGEYNATGIGTGFRTSENDYGVDGVLYVEIEPTTYLSNNYTFLYNTWVNIVITSKSGEHKAYVNGNLVGSSGGSAVARIIGANRTISICKQPTVGYPFWGGIDELAFWNRTLTTNEVIDLYNGGTGIFYNEKSMQSIIINSPLNKTYTNSTILHNITIVENGTCIFSYGGGIINFSMSSSDNRNWNGSLDSLSEGDHNVTFYCNDSAGNWVMNDTIYSVDTIAPFITINSPLDFYYQNATIDYNVTTNENSFCVLYDGSGNYTMSSSDNKHFNLTKNILMEGYLLAMFYCNDSAGNMGSNYTNYKIDTTNPNATLIYPKNANVANSSINLIINLTDNVQLKNITTNIINSSGYTTKISSNYVGIINQSNQIISLAIGNYTWYVILQDQAGNIFDGKNYNATFNVIATIIPLSPIVSSPIYQAMESTGAGLAVFIEYMNKGFPIFLLGLMLVAIFVIIGSGIKILIKKFSHSHK